MKTNSPYTKEFLEKFRNHLEELKIKVDNRTIGSSGNGRIGLSRWYRNMILKMMQYIR
jgi:hypothetical protein